MIASVVVNVPMLEAGDLKCDVAIILGYPASEDGQPSQMLKQRMMKGVELFKHQLAHSLLMTGGAAHNRYVEASVMAKLAKSMGVPEDFIVQEMRAHV
ncbi:MAG: YdcF family protein [Gloeobacterales cyanobacterium]